MLLEACAEQYRHLSPSEPEVNALCNFVCHSIIYNFGMHLPKRICQHFGRMIQVVLPNSDSTFLSRSKRVNHQISKFDTRYAKKVRSLCYFRALVTLLSFADPLKGEGHQRQDQAEGIYGDP